MKKIFLALMLVAMTLTMTGCAERIDSGNVGIKVNLYGSDKGVDNVTEVSGLVFYNPMSTEIREWPTYMKNAAWTANHEEGKDGVNQAIDFKTNDGTRVTVNVGMSYAYDAAKVPAMFKKFRQNPDVIQDTYLRTQVRNVFTKVSNNYSIEQFIEHTDRFLNEVNEAAKVKLGVEGFIIDTISFMGSPDYPASIEKSIQDKIAASQLAQQKERELEQEQAEAAKKVAHAQGIADAKKIEAEGVRALTASLTPAYLKYLEIEKWNGQQPQVVSGSNGMSLIVGSK